MIREQCKAGSVCYVTRTRIRSPWMSVEQGVPREQYGGQEVTLRTGRTRLARATSQADIPTPRMGLPWRGERTSGGSATRGAPRHTVVLGGRRVVRRRRGWHREPEIVRGEFPAIAEVHRGAVDAGQVQKRALRRIAGAGRGRRDPPVLHRSRAELRPDPEGPEEQDHGETAGDGRPHDRIIRQPAGGRQGRAASETTQTLRIIRTTSAVRRSLSLIACLSRSLSCCSSALGI